MNAALDYRNVDSIGHSRIMASINQFAERTVDFLNRFSNICDLKLLEVSERINNVEILTTILEKKLSSVNGLGFIPGQPLPPSPQPVQNNNNIINNSSQPPPPPPPPQSNNQNQPIINEQPKIEEEQKPEEPEAYDPKKDPAYANFFRLKSIGVPVNAFKQKMIDAGLDPSVLEDSY